MRSMPACCDRSCYNCWCQCWWCLVLMVMVLVSVFVSVLEGDHLQLKVSTGFPTVRTVEEMLFKVTLAVLRQFAVFVSSLCCCCCCQIFTFTLTLITCHQYGPIYLIAANCQSQNMVGYKNNFSENHQFKEQDIITATATTFTTITTNSNHHQKVVAAHFVFVWLQLEQVSKQFCQSETLWSGCFVVRNVCFSFRWLLSECCKVAISRQKVVIMSKSILITLCSLFRQIRRGSLGLYFDVMVVLTHTHCWHSLICWTNQGSHSFGKLSKTCHCSGGHMSFGCITVGQTEQDKTQPSNYQHIKTLCHCLNIWLETHRYIRTVESVAANIETHRESQCYPKCVI